MEQANPQNELPTLPPEVKAVLARCLEGDESCAAEVLRVLDEHPWLVDRFGDLVQHIATKRIARCTQNLIGRKAVGRKFDQMRAELRETAATPIEKLLADRLAACCLDANACDLDLAHRLQSESGDTPTVRAAERRVNDSQRRLLAASKALAIAQKFLRPAPTVLEVLGGNSANTRSRKKPDQRASFNPATEGAPLSN
jgi:hypothetical protein